MPTRKQFNRALKNKVHYEITKGAWLHNSSCGNKHKYHTSTTLLYDKVTCLKCLRYQMAKGSKRAKTRWQAEWSKRAMDKFGPMIKKQLGMEA